MSAPDELWLHSECGDFRCGELNCTMWCEDSVDEGDVRYIRADTAPQDGLADELERQMEQWGNAELPYYDFVRAFEKLYPSILAALRGKSAESGKG